MSNLTDAERESLRNAVIDALANEDYGQVTAAVERIVAERQAQALEDAADEFYEHPDSAFRIRGDKAAQWLHARAAELRGDA